MKIRKAEAEYEKVPEEGKKDSKDKLKEIENNCTGQTMQLAGKLQELTRLESRVTILGHLQRGGTPSAADRLLSTRLGTSCMEYIQQGKFGVMVAAKGDRTEPVALKDIVGKVKKVPADHPWIISARNVGTSFGD